MWVQVWVLMGALFAPHQRCIYECIHSLVAWVMVASLVEWIYELILLEQCDLLPLWVKCTVNTMSIFVWAHSLLFVEQHAPALTKALIKQLLCKAMTFISVIHWLYSHRSWHESFTVIFIHFSYLIYIFYSYLYSSVCLWEHCLVYSWLYPSVYW